MEIRREWRLVDSLSSLEISEERQSSIALYVGGPVTHTHTHTRSEEACCQVTGDRETSCDYSDDTGRL